MSLLDYETPPPPGPVPLRRRLKWLLIACLTYLVILVASFGAIAFSMNLR